MIRQAYSQHLKSRVHQGAMNEKVTNRVFIQRNQATGEERTFEVFNDKYIQITTRELLRERSYHLNLSMLEPWPSRQRNIAWRWMLSLIYFSIATAAYLVYLIQNSDSLMLSRLIVFVVVFTLLAIGSLLMFLYRSPNVMVFRSRYCGVVLISLFLNNPNKTDFKSFVEELKVRILSASQAVRIDKNQMLFNEITKLRRLTNEGVLGEDDYERAKRRIPNMPV